MIKIVIELRYFLSKQNKNTLIRQTPELTRERQTITHH